jgi:signal transduction histidine kinase
VWINKKDIVELSENIRKIIDGQNVDLRHNSEGVWSILKNDIHTLANLKNEQNDVLKHERDSMSETLTNISHQLKTPLTSMMIMADLLHDAPTVKQTEFLSNIKIGLARMEWLTSALLKMAKLDVGAVEFSREPIQSYTLARLALEPLQILLDIKNQTVDISCETELFCDRRWTAEALTNVIKNASEYSPKGSKIYVESGMNPICRWIAVTDSGEGIPGNKITNLFKRFEGTRSDKGYGIGLPLALAIMRGQNGDIEVDGGGNSGVGVGGKSTDEYDNRSNKGGGNRKGATFTLKFFK